MRERTRFEFIDEGLDKIKNADAVDLIKPVSNSNGWGMWAKMADGSTVGLTKPLKNPLLPPRVPLSPLTDKFDKAYWQSFGVLEDKIAINKRHVNRLTFAGTKRGGVDVYAHFKDGVSTHLASVPKKYFTTTFKDKLEQMCGIKFEDITDEVRGESDLIK